jgi:acetyl-CoA carboxylase carboxyltransferase component
MGLEGAVRLGFRAELEAIANEGLRAQAFEHMVAAAYEHGRSLNVAAHLELDDVIDPLDTRSILGQTIDRALLNYERPSHSRFVDPF